MLIMRILSTLWGLFLTRSTSDLVSSVPMRSSLVALWREEAVARTLVLPPIEVGIVEVRENRREKSLDSATKCLKKEVAPGRALTMIAMSSSTTLLSVNNSPQLPWGGLVGDGLTSEL